MAVKDFLTNCELPKSVDEVEISDTMLQQVPQINSNPIKHIIAIDGGLTPVSVKKEFPSSTITFFQFGILSFSVSDLEGLADQAFIDPEDIAKLKNIQRLKLTLPTKNINIKGEKTLTNSIRNTLFQFFNQTIEGDNLLKTLEWFLFQDYCNPITQWNLATCPNRHDEKHSTILEKKSMQSDYSFFCGTCGEKILLTDVFRLHEAIDDELGAGGILGYVVTLIEQMLLVHILRMIINTKPSLLNEIMFIKDGPLAFFGQTANIHKPMRCLTNFLLEKYNLYLAGLEKSGFFVEHANEIASKLKPGDLLLLNNNYIYKYIIPGKADDNAPYARSSYYGAKLIYKAHNDGIHVITLPVKDEKVVLTPCKSDFKNIDIILSNIEKLKCDMYDCSLIPVALVNKLVSLANHPSSVILEKFAKSNVKK